MLKVLETLSNDLEECNNLTTTLCHGDLTMDNIIYDERNSICYLIDFLDNYIEHYWFDIVKLFQDIEGMWYSFRNPDIDLNNILPKMEFMKNQLDEDLVEKEEFYKEYRYLFLAINFARILPYANPESIDYLTSTINKFLIKHKEKI